MKRILLQITGFILSIFLFFPVSFADIKIDENNILIVEGKPFFPIGIYHAPVSDNVYDELSEAGFNLVQVWSSRLSENTLDLLNKHRLYALVEMPAEAIKTGLNFRIIDEIVKRFKNDRPIIAWYPIDEPQTYHYGKVITSYNLIKKIDAEHPVYMVFENLSLIPKFKNTFDILAIDPYPINITSIDLVSKWTEEARKKIADKKPVWVIPQIHNFNISEGGRYPTPLEERCMVYQAVVHGAKGIIWFNYSGSKVSDLWKEVKKIASELRELTPILLTPELKNNFIKILENDSIHLSIKKFQNKYYIFAVNVKEKPIKTELSFEELPGNLKQAKVLFEDRYLEIINGKIKDNFGIYGVHIYEISR